MKLMPNSLLTFALILLMLGCTSVVSSSAMKLRNISPLEADPRQIAARMTLPDGLGIVPETAQLTLEGRRTDTGETLSGVFTFTVQQGQSTEFRLSPAEAARLAAHQSKLREWKETLGDVTEGSLSVNLVPCLIAEGPAPDARVSIDLQLDAKAGFLALIRNGPISAVAGVKELQDLTACVEAS